MKMTAITSGDLLEKITAQTVEGLLSGGSLRFAPAEGPGNPPAESAAMGALVNPVIIAWDCGGADPELFGFGATRLPLTLLYFPTVFLRLHSLFISKKFY